MKINRDNVKWAAKLWSILLVVGIADGLAGTFLRRPLPWVAIIPGFVPVLVSLFVIIPMIRAEKKEHL